MNVKTWLLATVTVLVFAVACTRPNCKEMREQLAKDEAALAALGSDDQPEAKARIRESIASLKSSISEHCTEEDLLGIAQ